MNQGIEILIARMDSNPEEFVPDLRNGYPPKWRDIMLSVEMRVSGGKEYKDQLPFLKDEEVKALWEKLQSLQGELFTKRVMNTLLQDSDKELSSFSSDRYAKGSKIKLTLSELELCNKAGIPPAVYAKTKAGASK